MVTPPKRVSREIRSARFSRRPPSFAVTLVALAIVFALAWTFFVRSGPSASAPLVKGIQGTYTWRPVEGVGEDGTFGAVAGGDAGGKASVPEDESVFSSHPPRVRLRRRRRAPRPPSAATADASPSPPAPSAQWPPVWRVATRSPLDYQGLAAIVRTAVEDGDEAVGIKPVKDGERAVWRAAMTLDGKEVNVVVDQQTGIVTWCSDDEATFTATVDWDSPPPADTTYSGRRAGGHGDGDHRGHGRLRAVTGGGGSHRRLPLRSSRTWRLTATGSRAVATVADGTQLYAWTGHPTEAGPISPPREPVIGQLYTRGLSWFTLEQLGPKATDFYGARPEGLAGLIIRREALAAADDAAVRERSRERRPSPGTRRAGRRCSRATRAGRSSSPARSPARSSSRSPRG